MIAEGWVLTKSVEIILFCIVYDFPIHFPNYVLMTPVNLSGFELGLKNYLTFLPLQWMSICVHLPVWFQWDCWNSFGRLLPSCVLCHTDSQAFVSHDMAICMNNWYALSFYILN